MYNYSLLVEFNSLKNKTVNVTCKILGTLPVDPLILFLKVSKRY
uniref:Uncharacterized protein n=1 Tax=Anguilla anguilla TaxID=7936 RepID=A0A0E9VG95_ANGAN